MASTSSSSSYRWDEIRKHTSRSDCWIVINDKVYDVTYFIDEHPGSDAVILDVAGQDATEEFEDALHSKRAEQIMAEYEIGRVDESAPDESTREVDEDGFAVPKASALPSAVAAAAAAAAGPPSPPADKSKPKPKPAPKPAPKARRKVPLGPGYSAMHWLRKKGTLPVRRPREYSKEELAQHNTATDCWMAIRGQIFDVTPYLLFHPGGADELLRGAGKDATRLFEEVHAWVNYQFLIDRCFVGVLKKS